MEKLADILKFFIEKRLFSSIISLMGAIIVLIYVPDTYWVLLKLGRPLFICLFFCVFFLIAEIACKAKHKLQKHLAEKQQDKEDWQKEIKAIHKFVDELPSQEKKLFMTFIENGNQPLLYGPVGFGGYPNSPVSLLTKNFIVSSSYIKTPASKEDFQCWCLPETEHFKNPEYYENSILFQYRIDPDFFDEIQKVLKTTGRLGNF